jgi:hypothetical protein
MPLRTRALLLTIALLVGGCAPAEIHCSGLRDDACLAAMEEANAAVRAVDPDARFTYIELYGLDGFDGVLDDGRRVHGGSQGIVIRDP